MAKPKLYLESTIISVLAARPSRDPLMAAMQESTQRWWEKRGDLFDLFVSRFVLEEIALGDQAIAADRLRIARQVSVLADSKTGRRFGRKLFRALSLPKESRFDAFHLAIAIEGGMDYLLTWNCAHIANPVLQPRVRLLAAQRGLTMPIICSPADFLEEGPDETESN